jgi:hypothetical protein
LALSVYNSNFAWGNSPLAYISAGKEYWMAEGPWLRDNFAIRGSHLDNPK